MYVSIVKNGSQGPNYNFLFLYRNAIYQPPIALYNTENIIWYLVIELHRLEKKSILKWLPTCGEGNLRSCAMVRTGKK